MSDRQTRRQFLRSAFALGSGLGLSIGLPAWAQGEAAAVDAHLPLTGMIRQVHDPVLIRHNDSYYLFHTGNGIGLRTSPDMLDWKTSFPASIFGRVPPWALEKIPGATNIWAPDVSYFNGKYHIYYSVSTFGSNRSVIGLVTNETLEFGADNYKWEDQGLVIESTGAENYNCIDANLILDEDEVPWLAFGSFWSGLKMVRLDYATGKRSADDPTVYPLAQRFVNSNSIEAPFITRKDGYYYLFVSFDFCCRGGTSTYRVMVGRSEAIAGPYVDRDGVEMLQGGGTQVTFPTERWKGPGHNAIYQEGDLYYIVYHSYDMENLEAPTLRIAPLSWDAEGWPSI